MSWMTFHFLLFVDSVQCVIEKLLLLFLIYRMVHCSQSFVDANREEYTSFDSPKVALSF